MSEPTERSVRTHAGWIGVQISRSRVRTPDKPGYGLYRVRGSVARRCGCHSDNRMHVWDDGEWTPYAFTLQEIETELTLAMDGPETTPNKPGDLWPRGRDGIAGPIPTRWTSAYRGPRTGRETWGPISAEGPTTVHSRRKAHNREYQEQHKDARAAGLAARHEIKLRRSK